MSEVDRYQPISEHYRGFEIMVTTAVENPEFWVSAVVLEGGRQIHSTQRAKTQLLEVAVAEVKEQARLWIDKRLAVGGDEVLNG